MRKVSVFHNKVFLLTQQLFTVTYVHCTSWEHMLSVYFVLCIYSLILADADRKKDHSEEFKSQLSVPLWLHSGLYLL